jgi:hypothetical protein
MHVPPLHSHHTVKLLASSGLLKRLASAIGASVVFLVGVLSPSVAHAQAVVGSVTSFGSGGNNATSYNIAKPSGLAVGDLMILSVAIEGSTSASATGFTQITSQANSSNFTLYVFRRIADAAAVSATNFTVSFGSSAKYSVGLARITGHNGTTPIGAFAGATGSGTAVTSPAITTTAANQLVLSFHGVKKSASFTGGPGTERYDVSADPPSHALYSYTQVAAGSTGTKSATSSQSEVWAAIQVAINSPTPTITASGSVTARSTTYGTASAAASFSVSGTALTGNLTVTPPAGFQTSLTEGSGYGSSTTLTAASGTVASTTVYVRLAAATAPGSYSGNISIAGGGATQQTIAVPSSTVAAKALTVTGLTGTSKVYNRSTAASASGTAALSGVVGADAVSLSGSPAFAFASANVGNGITISTTGYSLSGANSGNYTLTQPSLIANITAKGLTISGTSVSNRVYNGTTTVAVTGGSLVGVVSPDAVTLGGSPTGTVTTAAVGDGKAVTVTGYSISGAQSGNYSLTQPTGLTVNITKATPTITAAPSASAITFGQTLASSTLSSGGGSVAGSFAFTTPSTAPNAGTAAQGITFTPTDSANYNAATGTVNVAVSPRALTITAGAASKASGAADPTLTYSSDGLLAGGSITGSLARASGETTGSYPITQGTLSAGSNYTISFTGANFFITGLKAMADSIQKPGTISALKIPVADLLANDGTLGVTGEVVPAPNLTVTAAQTSLGAPLAIRGQFILFLPATTGEETLTYTVSNGTATATATVTLTGEASAPSFSLEVIKRGTAAFSGGSTSVTHDFLGVPNLTYRIQYSTDLSSWTTAPDQSSGSTGSFSVTFTQSGDFAASWNSQMFFRATKP